MKAGFDNLQVPPSLKQFLGGLIEGTSSGLDQVFEDNLHLTQEAKQFKKVQRWFGEDKMAVMVARLHGVPILVLSAHGESGGHTSCQVLLLAHALYTELSQSVEGLELLIGMDANVKTSNTGSAATPDSLLDTAHSLGFSYCSMEDLVYAGTKGETAKHTVLKTRSFLQPQLKGKAGVPDENMKDWIFYCPSQGKRCHKLQGRLVNNVNENDPEGSYVSGGMPRGLDFPSDHAIVVAECKSYHSLSVKEDGELKRV